MVSKQKLSLVLFVLGMVVYVPSLSGKFFWDDEQFITQNEQVKQVKLWPELFRHSTTTGAGLVSNYYRPLTSLSFGVDRLIWGLEPLGFHLTNNLMHSLAGVVLFLLLCELGLERKLAAFVAAVFLVHPVQVEAVAYVNSRGDSFYALLLFAGLYLYAHSFRKEIPDRLATRNRQTVENDSVGIKNLQAVSVLLLGSKRRMLGWAIACYFLAILAKEVAVAGLGLYGLVLVKELLEGIPRLSGATQSARHARDDKLALKSLASLSSLAIRYKDQAVALGVMMVGLGGYLYARMTALNFVNSLNFVGDSSAYAESVWVRLFTFGRVFWTYIGLLLVPYPLHYERTSEILAGINFEFMVMLAVIVGLLALGWWEWKKMGKVWIWLGTLWFAGMLIPVSGVIPINGLIYEHWLYVPMVGFGLLAYGVFGLLVEEAPYRLAWRIRKAVRGDSAGIKSLPALSAVVVGAYSLLSVRQEWIWAEPSRFYEYTLQYANTARLHTNLGNEYLNKKELDKAVAEFVGAIAVNDGLPETYYNLGRAYELMGEDEKAKDSYERAIELAPAFFYAYPPLIELLIEQESYGEAVEYAEGLVKLNPYNWQWQFDLGKGLYLAGDEEEARVVFAKARKLSGDGSEFDKLFEEVVGE